MVAEVIDNTTSRGRTLRFLYDCPHDEFKKELFALGEAPLPRYIIDNRPKEEGQDFAHATEEDMEYFQTPFAEIKAQHTVGLQPEASSKRKAAQRNRSTEII